MLTENNCRCLMRMKRSTNVPICFYVFEHSNAPNWNLITTDTCLFVVVVALLIFLSLLLVVLVLVDNDMI